jgi:predicted metallo-beta-lactamase superfamily hydrolase
MIFSEISKRKGELIMKDIDNNINHFQRNMPERYLNQINGKTAEENYADIVNSRHKDDRLEDENSNDLK